MQHPMLRLYDRFITNCCHRGGLGGDTSAYVKDTVGGGSPVVR
jgi:hypothetical protein